MKTPKKSAKSRASLQRKWSAKLVDAQGIVSYEVEVNKEDYLFTVGGQFLQKQVTQEDDKD